MRTLSNPPFRLCAIAVGCAGLLSGCLLDRSPIRPAWASVEPAQFCPGDTLRASYDFLGGRTCPAGVDCSPYFPNLAVSSTPTSFTPMSFRAYSAGFDFTPAGDTVTVTFDIDRDNVLIPTEEFRDGTRVFLQRTGVTDLNVTARRITAPIGGELLLPGMCSGALPFNAPATLETLPRLSPRLGLASVCNISGFAVNITLNAPGGAVFSTMLADGGCVDTSMPGVPTAIRGTQMIEARPVSLPPGTMCSATGPSTPPPTIRLSTSRNCG